jgi:transcriptional regulator with XRE-family HTH domain
MDEGKPPDEKFVVPMGETGEWGLDENGHSASFMVADRIRLARKRNNLSVGELADRVGVSRTRVSAWENRRGLPDAVSIRRLAIALESSADWLLALDLLFAARYSGDPHFSPMIEAPLAREMREQAKAESSVTPPARAADASESHSAAELAATNVDLADLAGLVSDLLKRVDRLETAARPARKRAAG